MAKSDCNYEQYNVLMILNAYIYDYIFFLRAPAWYIILLQASWHCSVVDLVASCLFHGLRICFISNGSQFRYISVLQMRMFILLYSLSPLFSPSSFCVSQLRVS